MGTAPDPFVRQLADGLTVPARVLDCGCGRGRNAVYLAGKGHRVLALDQNADQVCAVVSASAGLPHAISAAVASLTALPVADSCADAVLCTGVFESLTTSEIQRACGELHRALRLGGRLLVIAAALEDADLAGAVPIELGTYRFPLSGTRLHRCSRDELLGGHRGFRIDQLAYYRLEHPPLFPSRRGGSCYRLETRRSYSACEPIQNQTISSPLRTPSAR